MWRPNPRSFLAKHQVLANLVNLIKVYGSHLNKVCHHPSPTVSCMLAERSVNVCGTC